MILSNRISTAFYTIILTLSILSFSCSPTRIIREFQDPSQLKYPGIHNKNIKIHLTDGSLYLLDSLIGNTNSDTVYGYGSYYNQYREITLTNKSPEGKRIPPAFQIPLSKVALFETNDITGLGGKVLAMALVGVPTAIVSIYCLANPKACFGSCPTFYCWDGNDTVLMAEGFSSSILRSFEKQDIDMLYHAKVTGNNISLKLTNEALETHVIRYADLLVFPRKQNERVFAVDNGMYNRVSEIRNPSSCMAPEGDCLDAVSEMDLKERYSKTDDKNLAKKEEIEVTFDSVPGGELGMIIGSRQTFLTTFMFYQSLAYMGHAAGSFAAEIESGNQSLQKKVNKVWNILGGIEVFFQDKNGKWIKAGQIDEMGPIASDVHVIRVPVSCKNVLKAKLRLTKGLWRINYLSLAKLGPAVEPVRIKPTVLFRDSDICSVNNTQLLADTLEPLVTLPGDSYILSYRLPSASQDYELFLCSKGYYLEWMREPWLLEENLGKASLMFGFPGIFMRMAAKDFKTIEPRMEENFWKSRYVKKN